jgi:hypothetical protein
MPPYYAEPVELVPGDYLPKDFPFDEVYKRGLAAVEEDKDKPRFTGTIGDFRLYSFDAAKNGTAAERDRCVVTEFRAAGELETRYVPGGTAALSPWYTGYCANDDVALVMREFLTKHGKFSIAYQPGERAFGHDAPSERITEQTLSANQAAVIIQPVLEEGFGRSWVAIETSGGFILVEAVDLPLSEVIKIAEGVTCGAC